MSVSLRKRGLLDFNGSSVRIGSVKEDTLRTAISLDLAENQLTTLQKPFQLATFSTPLSKQEARARHGAQSREAPTSSSLSVTRQEEQDDDACSAFNDMKFLRSVSLAHNMLRSLIGVGAAADTLTVLIAPHNQLESVRGLERCVCLRYVDLRHNRLGSLAGLPVGALTAPVTVSPDRAPTTLDPGNSPAHGSPARKASSHPIKPTSKPTPVKAGAATTPTAEAVAPPFEPGTPELVEGGIVLLLSNNRLRGRALAALSTPPMRRRAEGIDRAGTSTPTWSSFISLLDLASNPLEEIADVERLLRAPHLAQLREVNLSYTPWLVNGSLASTLRASAADGLIAWPVPPPSTTRAELFPDVSAETATTAAVASGLATSPPSKAELAAACEGAVQRAKTLCRLASACASALWPPADGIAPSAVVPRVVKLIGAAPAIEFLLATLTTTHTGPLSQSGSPSRVLLTPPPSAKTPTDQARRTPDVGGSPFSPIASSVPPVVVHTVPRRAHSCSPGTDTRLRANGSASAVRQDRQCDGQDASGTANCSVHGEAGTTSVLHTSTWSANEDDSTVGYMIFKGRQPPPLDRQRGSLHHVDEPTRDAQTRGTVLATEPEAAMDAMSSIAEGEESLASSMDSQPFRPPSRLSQKTIPDTMPARDSSETSLQVRLNVLLAENQALRRRNAELEGRHREHKQLVAQHRISADILREELDTVRGAASARQDVALKNKSEIKRLRDRVGMLEQQLAKARGAASAAGMNGNKS